jgi:hypothetical protein
MNRLMIQAALYIVVRVPLVCLLMSLANTPAQGGVLRRVQIVSSATGLQGAAISPDGSKVAIYLPNRLKIYDVSSLRVDASVELPSVPEGRYVGGGEPESGVRYCDRGKYILIYGGNATFFVIDAIGYRRTATIDLDIPKAEETAATVIAGSCSAESNVAVIEVSPSQDDWVGAVKVFNLDSGRQTGEIPLGSRSIYWRGVDVSPSGSHALIYLRDAGSPDTKIALLDIGSSKLSASIDTGFYGGQATFIGESSIAVVGGHFLRFDTREVIKIFDAQTGAPTREIGDSTNAPKVAVDASADGRFLFAYTGEENYCGDCDEHSRGNLQIEHARFTVWDLTTGRIVAQSPSIPFEKGHGRVAIFWKDPACCESTRPQFQFSQSGNAVLTTRISYQDAVDVYLLK